MRYARLMIRKITGRTEASRLYVAGNTSCCELCIVYSLVCLLLLPCLQPLDFLTLGGGGSQTAERRKEGEVVREGEQELAPM